MKGQSLKRQAVQQLRTYIFIDLEIEMGLCCLLARQGALQGPLRILACNIVTTITLVDSFGFDCFVFLDRQFSQENKLLT